MGVVGILHPGAMGVSVAASAINSGHRVIWASENRSQATRQRAAQYNLTDVETLAELCVQSEIILSICPPHAAEECAHQVIAQNFRGIYCDANAISPERARRIGDMLRAAAIDFVDGGIIGGPAWTRGETWLYLSGERARALADCFAQGHLETKIIGTEIGTASALKMCYAAYTKGTTALLCAILGASEQLGVRAELYAQWTRDDANFVCQTERRARNVTQKAWRFEGEMREIAATFASVGMPGEFHLAAAEIYRRLAPLKSANDMLALEDVLQSLTRE
ncbi:MAG: NAD(P)-dependent oxidoreductase [Chloroflexota bacterium]|nr:MAG: NAD(P)-dependent oxidoreductase [Chloroflexota bacterium]